MTDRVATLVPILGGALATAASAVLLHGWPALPAVAGAPPTAAATVLVAVVVLLVVAAARRRPRQTSRVDDWGVPRASSAPGRRVVALWEVDGMPYCRTPLPTTPSALGPAIPEARLPGGRLCPGSRYTQS